MLAASQSFKIYEILNKHFRNEADAKALVTEIEAVIETRFLAERDRLATKEDLAKTKNEIILWIVGFNTVLAGLIITLIKVL
ncbi:MAG: hypothetical protein ABI378_08240 [Chitinophagaceae bacterium]